VQSRCKPRSELRVKPNLHRFYQYGACTLLLGPPLDLRGERAHVTHRHPAGRVNQKHSCGNARYGKLPGTPVTIDSCEASFRNRLSAHGADRNSAEASGALECNGFRMLRRRDSDEIVTSNVTNKI